MNAENYRGAYIDDIPLMSVIKRILSFWYLFLGGLSISLVLAFMYLNDQQNIYEIKANIRLNDQTTDDNTAQNFMKEMEMFSSNEELEDEIGVLTSFDLIENTVNRMDVGVSYHKKGIFGTIDVGKFNAPFWVIIDSLHDQLAEVPIYVSSMNNEYALEIDADQATIYVPFNSENKGIKLGPKYQVLTSDFYVERDLFSFQIITNPNFDNSNIDFSENYFFVIHSLEKLVRAYRQKLSVKPLAKEGNLLELKTTGPIIENEKKFIDTLINVYLDNERLKKRSAGERVIELINKKIITIEDSLLAVENNLELFRSQSNIMDIQTTSSELTKQLLELEGEKSRIEGQNQQFQLILNYLEQKEDGSESVAPSAINVNDPILAPIWTQLTELYQRRSQLQQSAKADNPQMQRLEREITNVERQLTENARNRVESSEISLQKVKERIWANKAQMNKLPGSEKRLRQLERERSLIDNTYQYLLQKREETSIALANTSLNKDVVDHAFLASPRSVSPNRFLILMIAALAGISIPLGIVLAVDYFDNRIRGLRDIQINSNIPVIGIIASTKSSTELLNLNYSDEVQVETFRALRIQLRNKLLLKETKSHVVGVTSTWASEGKTYVSANLSCALAMSGKKTVLIDLDLRKSSLSRYFPFQGDERGITSYLLQDIDLNDIIYPTQLNNLEYIPAGPRNQNALDYIESERFHNLIKILKNIYDYVIVDTPPIGQTSDYIYFKGVIDFTLFIIRHKQTPKNTLSQVNQLYQQMNNMDIGLVVNDVPKKEAFGNGDGVFGYGKKLEY